ncbi:hypothetical protein BGZ89_007160 [Linnemannia elongata]|nr:hypothetical protein BGZ89_007160 [Linnemannia elongata]
MNVERNVDQARDVAQEVPQVFASKAQSALESVKQMDVVKRYVFPRTDMFKPPQGGFPMFGSVFLLPALGVSLLVACGVGLINMGAYVGYLMACAVLGMICGQGDTREARRRIREAKQRAYDGGRLFTS